MRQLFKFTQVIFTYLEDMKIHETLNLGILAHVDAGKTSLT